METDDCIRLREEHGRWLAELRLGHATIPVDTGRGPRNRGRVKLSGRLHRTTGKGYSFDTREDALFAAQAALAAELLRKETT